MPTASPTRHALALVPVVLTLALAACGEDDSGGGGATRDKRTADDFDITGRWQGTLHQLGLGAFEVEAEIRSLEAGRTGANSVSYTVIDCSGTWEYRGIEAGAFRFREVIDVGEGDDCAGAGTVTLEPARDDELAYSFSGGGLESRGTLERAP